MEFKNAEKVYIAESIINCLTLETYGLEALALNGTGTNYQIDQLKKIPIRHLVLASFRGRAAVKPFITDEGLIFKKLENWNYLNYNGKNYWSIDSQPVITFSKNSLDLPEIPKDEICYIVDDKPLDWCGLTIYLR